MARTLPVVERLTSRESGFIAFNAVYAVHSMYGPHTHEDHEINIVISGEAWYEHPGFGKLTMRQGDILILPGGIPHKLVVPEAVVFRCFVISVDHVAAIAAAVDGSADCARLCSAEKPFPPRVTTDNGIFEMLDDLYRQYLSEHARPDRWAIPSCRRLGELAAVQFVRLMERPLARRRGDADARTEMVRSWMDRNFPEPVSLAQLADMAHLSASHFSALFRQQTGQAPMAYLYRRRLDHAAVLLARTTRPVTSIAGGVGYENLEHFSRAFRTHTGASPLAFRKKHQV